MLPDARLGLKALKYYQFPLKYQGTPFMGLRYTHP